VAGARGGVDEAEQVGQTVVDLDLGQAEIVEGRELVFVLADPSGAFAAACITAGIRQSMSKVGSSADNALAESFNASFKRETLQGRRAFSTSARPG
jgi:hypothetical protein